MSRPTSKAFCNWSGGKDSALACYYAMQDKEYSVAKLVTNITKEDQRISMHGVHETLLDMQARAIGIPLQKMILPAQPSMYDYEKEVSATLGRLQREGFTHNIFGDIFLEDLKQYRENQLSKFGMRAVFPLWKKDTRSLLQTFINLGFKAVVVCVQASKLEKSFAGRIIDNSFLNDLPNGVDACGENGEFHTFVFDGPIFKAPVSFTLGEYYYKELNAPSSTDGKTSNTKETMGFWHRELNPL
ncbi:MAG: diphthine--ammonia ligase [Chitinophagaceae bacterium]|nr:diphthine--ammonia ligase [Chitinophagaceae bacterium]